MTQSKAQTMLNQRKIRLIKYLSLSLALMSFSCIIAMYDPLERLIEDQLTMREGSFLFYMWKKPPLPVIMKVYVFNITNAEAFLSGADKKLKFAEVGPYCYQEFLEHKNTTFHENGTLSYVPHRYTIPLPHLSVGDPHNDVIVTLNLPLLGFSSATQKLSTFASLAFSTIAKSTNSKPILNLTVHDFLWGYDDRLISVGNTVLPDFINFERIGLMDRLFDEGHNVISMNLPKSVQIINSRKKSAVAVKTEVSTEPPAVSLAITSNKVPDVEYDSDYEEDEEILFNGIESVDQLKEVEKPREPPKIRDYSIDLWKGSPGLKHWGFSDTDKERNSQCNTIQGSFDGTMFPRNVTTGAKEKFRVYRVAFCRTLPIEYLREGSEYGIRAHFYKLSENAFDDSLDDPESMCFCSTDKVCMKRGLGNITPCYYKIPIAVSLPHFLNSDPSLLEGVEGLQPVKEKHESMVAMQPRLGVPIKVRTRIQLNLICGETKFNSEVKKFDNMALPVFWMEIAIEDLTPLIHVVLQAAFNVLPIVQNASICLLMFAGICYFGVLIAHCFFLPMSLQQSNGKFNSKKSIKYTAMFPYIKREMAKFEDREREMIQKTETV